MNLFAVIITGRSRTWPEYPLRSGALGSPGITGSRKAIWKIHSADCMRKEKYGKRKNMPFFIQDSLISIISRFMLILFQM